MALLMHWLCQADAIGLEAGGQFVSRPGRALVRRSDFARRLKTAMSPATAARPGTRPASSSIIWKPTPKPTGRSRSSNSAAAGNGNGRGGRTLDDRRGRRRRRTASSPPTRMVVYRDSTDDGIEGADLRRRATLSHDELLQRIEAGRRAAGVSVHRRPTLAAVGGQPDSDCRRAG